MQISFYRQEGSFDCLISGSPERFRDVALRITVWDPGEDALRPADPWAAPGRDGGGAAPGLDVAVVVWVLPAPRQAFPAAVGAEGNGVSRRYCIPPPSLQVRGASCGWRPASWAESRGLVGVVGRGRCPVGAGLGPRRWSLFITCAHTRWGPAQTGSWGRR